MLCNLFLYEGNMQFQLIYAHQIKEFQKEKKAIVIDIRESNDYNKSHWKGAVNVPYAQLESIMKKKPPKGWLILYCWHGGRSMELARNLGRKGYYVATVIGGYEAMKNI